MMKPILAMGFVGLVFWVLGLRILWVWDDRHEEVSLMRKRLGFRETLSSKVPY